MTGCYLCTDAPPVGADQAALDAWNEACDDCDRSFWSNPALVVLDADD